MIDVRNIQRDLMLWKNQMNRVIGCTNTCDHCFKRRRKKNIIVTFQASQSKAVLFCISSFSMIRHFLYTCALFPFTNSCWVPGTADSVLIGGGAILCIRSVLVSVSLQSCFFFPPPLLLRFPPPWYHQLISTNGRHSGSTNVYSRPASSHWCFQHCRLTIPREDLCDPVLTMWPLAASSHCFFTLAASSN